MPLSALGNSETQEKLVRVLKSPKAGAPLWVHVQTQVIVVTGPVVQSIRLHIHMYGHLPGFMTALGMIRFQEVVPALKAHKVQWERWVSSTARAHVRWNATRINSRNLESKKRWSFILPTFLEDRKIIFSLVHQYQGDHREQESCYCGWSQLTAPTCWGIKDIRKVSATNALSWQCRRQHSETEREPRFSLEIFAQDLPTLLFICVLGQDVLTHCLSFLICNIKINIISIRLYCQDKMRECK